MRIISSPSSARHPPRPWCSFSSAMVFIAASLLISSSCHGYISNQAVPRQRQLEWLKEMTHDFNQVQLGRLSQGQLKSVPKLMHAWKKTPQKSVEKALALESMVKRIIDERQAGNTLVDDLTVQDYNCLLEGWARSGAGYAAAERCDLILQAMQQEGGLVEPDTSSYKTVLMAWRQAVGDKNRKSHTDVHVTPQHDYAAVRAQRMLESMVTIYQKDEENSRVVPNADCFDIVLQTWSRSKHPKAPQNAEALLATMERLYESTGQAKPRTTSFNAVLTTWARSTCSQAASRALELFQFMEVLEQDHGDAVVAPDNASYCTVMVAIAKQDDPIISAIQAECLLKHAEDRYKMNKRDGKPISIVPDTILFNTAIGRLAKSNLSGSYRKARSILDRQSNLHCDLEREYKILMKDNKGDNNSGNKLMAFSYKSSMKSCQPDVFGYTSVIASCASESGTLEERQKAFNVAYATFRQMERNGIPPNYVTYGNMLKACARLLPPASATRRKWATRFFHQARHEGCVGDMVLGRTREALPPKVFQRECLQGHGKQQLPDSWSRHVPANHNRQHRSSILSKKKKRAEV